VISAGAEVIEMGWEVCPQGLYELLARLQADYNPLSIYVTENGAAFPDEATPDGRVFDPRRIAYLDAHLRQVHRALQDGVPLHPGRFLRDDIEAQALAALQQTATLADVTRMGSPEEIVVQAQRRARGAPPRYSTFAWMWPRLMDALSRDRFLRNHWQARMKES